MPCLAVRQRNIREQQSEKLSHFRRRSWFADHHGCRDGAADAACPVPCGSDRYTAPTEFLTIVQAGSLPISDWYKQNVYDGRSIKETSHDK